jgi:hypothetical protein
MARNAIAFLAAGGSCPATLAARLLPLAGLIPHARVKIYPDSAHGFSFQRHAEFAADVQAFLTAASRAPTARHARRRVPRASLAYWPSVPGPGLRRVKLPGLPAAPDGPGPS